MTTWTNGYGQMGTGQMGTGQMGTGQMGTWTNGYTYMVDKSNQIIMYPII